MSISNQLGSYFEELFNHYRKVGTSPKIPYAYSLLASTIGGVTGCPHPSEENTYVGFNTRKQNTMESSETHINPPVNGVSYTRSLHFKFFLYDMFYGVRPWELGIDRKAFAFEDTIIMDGSFESVDTGSGSISLSGNTFSITFWFFDLITGKLRTKKEVTVQPVTVELENYWLNLIDVVGDYDNTDKFFDMANFSGLDVSSMIIDEYSSLNPLSYQVVSTTYTTNGSSLDEQYRKTTIVQNSLQRLSFTSALNSGSWSDYPLGDSPLEATARHLSMHFNNKYATTQTGAGVMQVLEAVDADMQEAFSANVQNAGINFSDLRSLYQAVQGYFSVMASDICSYKRLPRVFNAYFQAQLDYYFFTSTSWPAIMELAVTHTLEYVKEDYSLSDDAATLRGYLNKYIDYAGANGVYYSSSNGEYVKRLGAAADNVQAVLTMYKNIQLRTMIVAIERERNILQGQAKFQGSFDLLDKAVTPQPGVAYTVYAGQSVTNIVCTGYNISIDSAGNYRTSVNFTKKV